MKMFVSRSRVGIFCNERTRSTPLDSKLMFWCVSYYLGAFGTVWLPLQNSVQNGLKWCKSSCHEVVSEFFATNVPDPPFWTITSCFGAFRTIWVHLAQFVALQHSVPNGPNLCKRLCHEVASEFFATNAHDPPYWTLNSCFAVFRTIWMHLGQFVALQHSVQNGPNWCKSSCHDVASEFFTTNAPDPPYGTLNSCFGVFRTIWVHLVAFGYLTKLGTKRAEVVQKFVP